MYEYFGFNPAVRKRENFVKRRLAGNHDPRKAETYKRFKSESVVYLRLCACVKYDIGEPFFQFARKAEILYYICIGTIFFFKPGNHIKCRRKFPAVKQSIQSNVGFYTVKSAKLKRLLKLVRREILCLHTRIELRHAEIDCVRTAAYSRLKTFKTSCRRKKLG